MDHGKTRQDNLFVIHLFVLFDACYSALLFSLSLSLLLSYISPMHHFHVLLLLISLFVSSAKEPYLLRCFYGLRSGFFPSWPTQAKTIVPSIQSYIHVRWGQCQTENRVISSTTTIVVVVVTDSLPLSFSLSVCLIFISFISFLSLSARLRFSNLFSFSSSSPLLFSFCSFSVHSLFCQ